MTQKLTPNQIAYQQLLKSYTKALIAEMAGVSRQAVGKWTSVPPERVPSLARHTGLPQEQILPEPYSTA